MQVPRGTGGGPFSWVCQLDIHMASKSLAPGSATWMFLAWASVAYVEYVRSMRVITHSRQTGHSQFRAPCGTGGGSSQLGTPARHPTKPPKLRQVDLIDSWAWLSQTQTPAAGCINRLEVAARAASGYLRQSYAHPLRGWLQDRAELVSVYQVEYHPPLRTIATVTAAVRHTPQVVPRVQARGITGPVR